MEKMRACCGFRCDLCPAYKKNIRNFEDQQNVSDGWYHYYGFKVPPEKIYCDGCLVEDFEDTRQIDTQCPIRACVKERDLLNCGFCDDYPCQNLKSKLVDIQEAKSKIQEIESEDEFERFIKPYENKKYFKNLRKIEEEQS
jgi:hypothetical protein